MDGARPKQDLLLTSLPLLPAQDPELGSIDPQLERQVETIRNLVDSYFGIVSKNVRDVVPKPIMFIMVNKVRLLFITFFSLLSPSPLPSSCRLSLCSQLKEYISTDLLPMIYAAGDQNEMMEESQEAAMRREEMIHMYHTCNDALKLISDVSSKTGL